MRIALIGANGQLGSDLAKVLRPVHDLTPLTHADVEVTDHGGGVFEIKAEIENSGYLPTAMAQGVTARSVAPTMVQLDVPPEDVLTGAAKTSFFQALDGSGSRETYVWVIRGRQGSNVTLNVRSRKSGSDTATITLR